MAWRCPDRVHRQARPQDRTHEVIGAWSSLALRDLISWRVTYLEAEYASHAAARGACAVGRQGEHREYRRHRYAPSSPFLKES
jgi:hypothetical protein